MCDKITVKLSLYMPHFQVAYQTEQLLQNKFFDSMFSFESDKMTAKHLLFIRHSQIVHQVAYQTKQLF